SQELLAQARRALPPPARRDAVDDAFGELAYGHLSSLRRIGGWRTSSLHRRRAPRDAEKLCGWRTPSCFIVLAAEGSLACRGGKSCARSVLVQSSSRPWC